MAEYDLHSHVQAAVALTSQTIGTNTTTDGVSVDTKGFESIEYIIITGTVTDGTYTLVLEESSTGAFAGEETVVPAANKLGDTVSIVAADDDKVFRVGSIGKERFQRLTVVSTGVTTGTVIAAVAVLGHPKDVPVAEQNT